MISAHLKEKKKKNPRNVYGVGLDWLMFLIKCMLTQNICKYTNFPSLSQSNGAGIETGILKNT